MNKEPNKSNEPNEEARVLSDAELEGIVGGGVDFRIGIKLGTTITADIPTEIPAE